MQLNYTGGYPCETVESDPTTIIVQENDEGDADADADLDLPAVDVVYDGDTEVTGTGEPGATVHVKDTEGNELGTGVVDTDGNFTVELDNPLVEGMEIVITQSQETDNGETVESDPVHVIVQASGAGDEGDGDDPVIIEDDGKETGDGEKLPNTSTSMFNWMIAGLMTMLAGVTGLFTRKRRKN